jgi:hypothetical protein
LSQNSTSFALGASPRKHGVGEQNGWHGSILVNPLTVRATCHNSLRVVLLQPKLDYRLRLGPHLVEPATSFIPEDGPVPLVDWP